MTTGGAARTVWIAGNWKMNLDGAGSARLAREIRAGTEETDGVTIALCPPFVYVPAVTAALSGSALLAGAQDCSAEEAGAYTGQVSAAQLADCGCRCVIVGHSERRRYQKERDAELALKARQALRHRLTPIFCVGETLEERRGGATEAVVTRQLEEGLGPALTTADGPRTPAPLVVAYEPVWAIGTGVTATPDEAAAVHRLVREWLARRAGAARAETTPILYGGSVTPENAAGLLAREDIDGALVGGASLSAASFLAIVRTARERKSGKERKSP